MNKAQIAKILNTHAFHHFIVALVVLNAVIFGLETSSPIMTKWGAEIELLNHIIIWIFAFELSIKLWTIGPREFFKNGWHTFDFIIVLVSILVPFGPWAALRVLRVLRLFVMLEFVPKMSLVIKTIHHALPGIAHTFIFGFILFYVWSLIGHGIFHKAAPELFGNIGQTMWTLFKLATMDGWESEIAQKISQVPLYWLYCVLFIISIALVVFNLCVGVIVDGLSQVSEAAQAKDTNDSHSIDNDDLRNELKEIKKQLAQLNKKLISKL
jgi:voltage-gated sodium channel